MIEAIRQNHRAYSGNPLYWGLLAFNVVMYGLVIPLKLL